MAVHSAGVQTPCITLQQIGTKGLKAVNRIAHLERRQPLCVHTLQYWPQLCSAAPADHTCTAKVSVMPARRFNHLCATYAQQNQRLELVMQKCSPMSSRN